MPAIRKYFILIALAVTFTTNLPAQTLRIATKAHPAIDSVVQSFIQQKWLSGAVTLVVEDGSVVHL
jgi:hypothetical protein